MVFKYCGYVSSSKRSVRKQNILFSRNCVIGHSLEGPFGRDFLYSTYGAEGRIRKKVSLRTEDTTLS